MALNDPGLQSLSSIAASEFYDVTITDTNSPIEQGDTLVVDYEVSNTGDKTGSQDITLEIDSVLEDTDAGVRVLANRTDSGTLEWVTASEETAQDYTATVLSADESAAQTVTVEDSETAIPDSEADQKLVHRWPLNDVNGSVEDTIGDADGTNNGVESVSGDWVGGSAGDGDGVDDHIETTTLGDFGSNMDTDCAVAFSIQTTDGDSSVLGVTADGNDNMRFEANLFSGFGSAEGELAFVIGSDGSSGDWSGIYTTNRIDDGEPRRVVCNKTGNTRSDLEIWIDGEEATTGDGNDEFNPSDVVNFVYPFLLFARNDGSADSPMDGVLDDICLFDDSLTETEIQSYNNPWE